MPLNTEVNYNNVVIKGTVELGVKGERGLQGFKGDQGPPVPVAHELGDDPDLAVSQKLLTDSIADMEQSNEAAVTEATHQAGLAGDSAVIATEQAGIAAGRAGESAQSAQSAGQYASTATEQAGIAAVKAGEASSSASDAASQAGLAANSQAAAEQAVDNVVIAVDGAADRAENAADRAETAADIASTAGLIFPTSADGQASEALYSDDYFWVESSQSVGALELWRKGASSPTDTGRRTATSASVEQAVQDVIAGVEGQVALAQSAAGRAELGAATSFANAKGAATITDARALVADTETFIVYPVGAQTFDAYRRTSGTTQVFLGSYPTSEILSRVESTEEDYYSHAFTSEDPSGETEKVLAGIRSSDGGLILADMGGASVQEAFSAAKESVSTDSGREFLHTFVDTNDVPIGHIDLAGRLILGGMDDAVQTVIRKQSNDISFLLNNTVAPYSELVPDPLYVDKAPDVVIGAGSHPSPLSVLVPGAAQIGSRSWATWYQNDEIVGEGPGDYAVLAFSDDGWLTSTEYAYIDYLSPEDSDKRVFDPALWVDPLGRLWLFFSIMGNDEVQDDVGGAWAVTIKNPLAEMPSISTPFRLSYYGIPMTPKIVNEQVIIPIDYWKFAPLVPSEAGKRLFRLHYEDRSIDPYTVLPDNLGPTSYDETNIVQRADGTILAAYRSRSSVDNTNTERVVGTIDKDGNVTWGAPETYAALGINPSSRIWLGMTPAGRVCVCYNNATNRSNLQLKLSDDGGETFPYAIQLTDVLESSYPIVTFDDEGNIYATYDQNRFTARTIKCSIVNEADLVAGTATLITRTITNK